VPLPPYALEAPVFPFRHLAGPPARAPIGGAREVALACFVAARLAAEYLHDGDDSHAVARAARCTGAKGWVGTLALPTALKGPLQRCLESSAAGGRSAMGRELAALATAAASYLDASSRAELDALATSLKG
jgi:hypothetical protein